MARTPRIGLACPLPGERAALIDWLAAGGFEPVPMIDAEAVGRELAGSGFEALVADVNVVTDPRAASWLLSLGINRPLIVVGEIDADAQMEWERRDAAYLARPATKELALLTVSLALAEGRPARRSPRRAVSRLPATIDSVPSAILDVSYEGLRLEIPDQERSALPPFFTVHIPMIRVGVVVKRVWVGSGESGTGRLSTQCGVALNRNTPQIGEAWRRFVDHAPSQMTTVTHMS